MAKNEILVHLDDRQIADLKKSSRQNQLKNEAEINKIRKNLDQISRKINDILTEIRELHLEPLVKKESDEVEN